LFLNGRSLGKKPVERYGHAAWSVPYEPGALSAKGFVDGAARLETRVETTTAPEELRMEADRTLIAADVVTLRSSPSAPRIEAGARCRRRRSVELAVEGARPHPRRRERRPFEPRPDRFFATVTRFRS